MNEYDAGVMAGAVWTLMSVLVGAIIAAVVALWRDRSRPGAATVPANTDPVPDGVPPTMDLTKETR